MSDDPQRRDDMTAADHVAALNARLSDEPPIEHDYESEPGFALLMMIVGFIVLALAFGHLATSDTWAEWSFPLRLVVMGGFVAAWFGAGFIGVVIDNLRAGKNWRS